jgi:DNA-binding NarL/FixJ family response regulator
MTIRVLLAGLPRILREIVEHALAEAQDIEVVGTVEALGAVNGNLAQLQPDVLIVGLDDESDATRLDRFLYEMPRLTCLAIAGDARRAFLYELQPRAKPLGDVSPGGLVRAIRTLQRVGAR